MTWIQSRTLWATPYPGSENRLNWSFTPYYPGNGEIPGLWVMLPFHSDLLANLINLPFLALGALTLRALLRRLGARSRIADLMAWTLFFLPYSWTRLVNTGYVEPYWLFLLLASMGYVADLLTEPPSVRSVVGLGLGLGLLLGAKSSAPIYVAVMLIAVLPPGRSVSLKDERVPGAYAIRGLRGRPPQGVSGEGGPVARSERG
ncbi:MAG: hypothetical protein HY815_26400 [Candidatus Riflebacteria bacterium]|nr:hypothetical protein [Candidatus Riflebacteria bacterium]